MIYFEFKSIDPNLWDSKIEMYDESLYYFKKLKISQKLIAGKLKAGKNNYMGVLLVEIKLDTYEVWLLMDKDLRKAYELRDLFLGFAKKIWRQS